MSRSWRRGNININRENVLKAFKDLRKQGLIARANYMCCLSCACAGISDYYEHLKEEKKKKIIGSVCWHHQDEQGLQEGWGLYLAYGPLGAEDDESTKAIGKLVVEALQNHGLKTEWDGSPNTRIAVVG